MSGYQHKYQKRQKRKNLLVFLCMLLVILMPFMFSFIPEREPETVSEKQTAENVPVEGTKESDENAPSEEKEESAEDVSSDEAGKTTGDISSGGEGKTIGDASSEGTEKSGESGSEKDTEKDAGKDTAVRTSFPELKERDVYTFLQGPVAWETETDWSGAWCEKVLGGQRFSVFGCGICDMANIYSTLTPYDCSPVDMFYYARDTSDYTPVSDFGAIDWPFMRDTLKTTGIYGTISDKDRTYEAFQKKIRGSITSIVLVSSANDNTYWHNVSGHYVNIWLYDEEDDTVFLADSGNPGHNRERIPLRYVYDALKTSGEHQYLMITSVDPAANAWKHDGIEDDWTVPEYYKERDKETEKVTAVSNSDKETEEITSVSNSDKETEEITAADNLVHVKPSEGSAGTGNLAQGNKLEKA